MSMTRFPLTQRTSANGGLPARRAIMRWAWRLFRREWRQQILILTLLTLAVTLAISGASAAYTLAPLGNSPATLGAANQAFVHDGADPQLLAANIATIEAWYGRVDVIGRRYVSLPGSAEIIEMRSQDPQGAYSTPMLALQAGRYPAGAGEVAITDGVAATFNLELNSRFVILNRERIVVGLVENPSDLRDEFVLVSPASADPVTTVSLLVRGSMEQFLAFPWPEQGIISHEMVESPANVQVLAAGAALSAAAIVMVLVALIAAAGFSVVAQRRQRQLGMLAAIGATAKHLRLVMVANGIFVGAAAAAVGATLGLLGWIAAVPTLETTVIGARINQFDLLPWWLVGIGMLLAILSAALAAWWPARAIARIPVVAALSGRPPQPRPLRPATLRAGLILIAGLLCLIAADPTTRGGINTILIVAGILAASSGVLLLSPVAVRILAAAAPALPVGVRLAWRDMARHQARSAVVLSAISLALGLAVAIILVVTRNERTADIGNLADNQLLVTVEGSRIRELVTIRTAAELEQLQTKVQQIAGAVDGAGVITLQMTIDPDETPNPGRNGNTWVHAVEVGDGERTANPGPLFVATPELLRYFGIDPEAVNPDTDVLTVRTGAIGYRRGIEETLVTNVARLEITPYTSVPTSFITPDALRREGWEAAVVGWLIVTDEAITNSQLAAARDAAASFGLMVEARDGVNLAALRSMRSGAMFTGGGVALMILALTLALLRSEAAADLRILTAAGATGSIRRTLAAATAAGLALLGVILGTVGAYLGFAAGFATRFEDLITVSWPHLLLVLVGVPLLAAVTGWLLGGRLPSTLARPTLE